MAKAVLSLTALILVAITVPSARAQQLVRIGYSGTGVAKTLHKTVERAGLWKKRNLEIRLIYFTSGATMAKPWSAETSTSPTPTFPLC